MTSESTHLDDWCSRTPGGISTVIHQAINAAEGQCAVLVNTAADFEFSRLARGRIYKFLLAGKDQLDRASNGFGQQRTDGFERIHIEFGAKCAANRRLDDTDVTGMDTHCGCKIHFVVIRVLCLGINGQPASRIEIGNDTTRAHATMRHVRHFKLMLNYDI